MADQAVLAGAHDVPPGVAKPIPASEFRSYVLKYAQAKVPPQLRATQNVEGVPPDLLWLFSRAGHGIVPFYKSVSYAKRNAMEKGAVGYTKIVIALIDRCFMSDGADLNYDSILDVADLIPLEQYKIVTSIR